jgi:hypothetical protein
MAYVNIQYQYYLLLFICYAIWYMNMVYGCEWLQHRRGVQLLQRQQVFAVVCCAAASSEDPLSIIHDMILSVAHAHAHAHAARRDPAHHLHTHTHSTWFLIDSMWHVALVSRDVAPAPYLQKRKEIPKRRTSIASAGL